MSFVRMPARNSSFRKSGTGRPKRPKKKPEWDSTLQDMNAYKASPEEIERRKLTRKSSNIETVRAEKLQNRIHRAKSSDRASGKNKKGSNALLREIFYNESQLEEALTASDQVMSMVKDLFGDDPRKFRGLPNVTTAPNTKSNACLPDGSTLEGPSKLDLLSDTIMDKSALNDLLCAQSQSDEDDQDEDTDSPEEAMNYEAVMDMGRFQRFLQAEKLKMEKEAKANRTKTAKQLQYPNSQGGAAPHEETTPPVSPRLMAMNDTGKISRHRSVLAQGQSEGENEERIGPPRMGDLQKALDDLETGVGDYERELGLQPSAQRLVANSLSGYTTALVDAVTRLTSCLKQNVGRMQQESARFHAMEEEMAQLKSLIHALTADVLGGQEEMSSLQQALIRHDQHQHRQIQVIMDALRKNNIEVATVPPLPKIGAQKVNATDMSRGHHPNTEAAQVGNSLLPQHRDTAAQLHHPLPQQSNASSRIQHPTPQYINPTPVMQRPVPQHLPVQMAWGQPQPDAVSVTSSNHALLLSPPKQGNSPRVTGEEGYLQGSESNTHSRSVNTTHQLERHFQNGQVPHSLLPKSMMNPSDVYKTHAKQLNGIETSFPSAVPQHVIIQAGQMHEEDRTLSQYSLPDSVSFDMQNALSCSLRNPQTITMKNTDLQSAYNGRHALEQPTSNPHQPASQQGLGRVPPCHDRQVSSQLDGQQFQLQPLDGRSQFQHGSLVVPAQQQTVEEGSSGMSLLEQQLADLNRQHAEAESKLQTLLLHQSDLQDSQDMRRLVSPPISPIPPASETESNISVPVRNGGPPQLPTKFVRPLAQRGIAISLPKVDMQDASYPSSISSSQYNDLRDCERGEAMST